MSSKKVLQSSCFVNKIPQNKNYNQTRQNENIKSPIFILFIQTCRTSQNYILIQTPQEFQFDSLTSDETFKYF